MTTHSQFYELKAYVGQSIIGQERVVERLLIALLANGNVLMEGLPGLAKTRAIKTLSKHVESDFRRIQLSGRPIGRFPSAHGDKRSAR